MRICISLVQRNEGRLLDIWIKYHSSLVRPQDIFIFDNMSTDPLTIDVIEKARQLNVNIISDFENFEHKGKAVSKLIADRQGEYDWFIPLDCDEFVATCDEDGVHGGASVVEDLSRRGEKPLIRIDKQILNVPHTSWGYFYPIRKLIVKSGISIELDKGYHRFDWSTNRDTVDPQLLDESKICYIHFHNRPFPGLIEAAKAKLSQRVPDFSRGTLESYKGEGVHLVNYFFLSPVSYLEKFNKRDVDFTQIFSDLGLDVPFSGP
ncbi:MAG: hypothetical protein HC900_03210 [Methylacidiphilales bacterium]|nr:hypothetical protein [Candidatus Methylacidiphilales bacterium]